MSAKNLPNDVFESLTIQECHLLYPALLANADRHLSAATLMAKEELYPIATAHLTIAAEDYIKAVTVYFKGWGMPVKQIKQLARFFDDKEEGYAVAPLTILLATYLKSVYHIFETITKSLFTLQFLEFKRIFEKKLNPLLLIQQANRYAKWWATAKKLKNRGFYLEYDIELHSPESITKEDYNLSLNIVSELKADALNAIEFTKKIPEKQRKLFFKWIKNYFEPFMRQLSKLPLNYFK